MWKKVGVAVKIDDSNLKAPSILDVLLDYFTL